MTKKEKPDETIKEENETKRRDAAIASIEKKYGTIFQWLTTLNRNTIDICSTGSISLDFALGVGGFARGRLVEIYGPPSGGKSSLALSTAANVTRNGGHVLYIDLERALDPAMPRSFGIDESRFGYTVAYSAEECLDIMRTSIESGAFAMCVVDSIAAFVPASEVGGDFDTSLMGLQARLISKMCRVFTPLIGRTNTLLMVINQTRANISPYGGNEVTTGGKALEFYSSHRVRVRFKGSQSNAFIKDATGNIIGHSIDFEVRKNKFAAPFKAASVDLIYGHGYDVYGELIDLSVEAGLLDRGGAGWYNFKGKKTQGKPNMIKELKEDKEFCNELKTELLELLKLKDVYNL